MKKLVASVLCIALLVMLGVPALADELPEGEPPAADYIETPEGGEYAPEVPEVIEPTPDDPSTPDPAVSSEPLPEETSSDPAAADSSSEETDRAESVPGESEPPPEEPAPEEPIPDTEKGYQYVALFSLGITSGLLAVMIFLRGI